MSFSCHRRLKTDKSCSLIKLVTLLWYSAEWPHLSLWLDDIVLRYLSPHFTQTQSTGGLAPPWYVLISVTWLSKQGSVIPQIPVARSEHQECCWEKKDNKWPDFSVCWHLCVVWDSWYWVCFRCNKSSLWFFLSDTKHKGVLRQSRNLVFIFIRTLGQNISINLNSIV